MLERIRLKAEKKKGKKQIKFLEQMQKLLESDDEEERPNNDTS